MDLHQTEADIRIEGIKLGVDEDVPIPPLRMLLNKGKRAPPSSSEETKPDNVTNVTNVTNVNNINNVNLVTIVTVSDSTSSSVESNVLAHL